MKASSEWGEGMMKSGHGCRFPAYVRWSNACQRNTCRGYHIDWLAGTCSSSHTVLTSMRRRMQGALSKIPMTVPALQEGHANRRDHDMRPVAIHRRRSDNGRRRVT